MTTIATPSATPPALNVARLCAYNAGIQLVWGAILGVALQARAIALSAPGEAVWHYSILAAGGALVATVVQPIVGRMSDRARARGDDRRRFYAVGTLLSVPAIVAFFLAPTFATLVATFLVLQATMNVSIGPYQAIIPDFVPSSRRGVASAWMSAFQSIGNASGLIIAGLIGDERIVAGALALPFVASYAISARHAGRLPAIDAPRVPAGATQSGGVLAALMLSRGAINVGFFTLLDYLLFFVRDSLRVAAGEVRTDAAAVFLAFTVCATLGAVAAAGPADRRDKRLVVSVAVGMVVVALGGLALATSLVSAIAYAAVAGAAWGAFVTADWALATAVLPGRSMASAMGVWNVATTLPQVVAPLVAGPIVVAANAARHGDGPRAAIAFAIVAFSLGGVAIWRLPRA